MRERCPAAGLSPRIPGPGDAAGGRAAERFYLPGRRPPVVILLPALAARARRLGGSLRRYGLLIVEAVVHALVARLTRAVGREDDLWVFGGSGGNAFAGNGKYLFLHVAAERPDVRAVWVTRDDELVSTLRDGGYEAYPADSLRGRLCQLRAGAVFLTHNFGDVDRWTVGGAYTVVLWHGVPLKRIGRDAELADLPPPAAVASRSLFRRYDLVLGTSEATLGPLVSGFRLPYDRFAPAGYPRTDVLLDDVPDADLGLDADGLARLEALDGDVVLYVPTFRSDPAHRAMARLDADALARLQTLCARRDAHLVLKPHPQEAVTSELDPYPRIHRIPGRCDVYPLLSRADVLVTDYSSVYLEFLLLDRPVVFYPYDLDRYRERRGLYYEYDAVTPGPRADDLDALRTALDRTLGGVDGHEASRERVRERFFDARDGDRSAAVAALVRRRLADG
jgi:CDP-glycerol glycerophosphotransferase (TagB/SpsB family)